jgi:glycosyltransferase involved in cell wall biosynthesis
MEVIVFFVTLGKTKNSFSKNEDNMNTKYRFSIITISLNASDAIKKTIESVVCQKFSDFEYIFVDGFSNDSTNEIIENYKTTLNRIGIPVTHISEPDKGISDAFNKGIQLAIGEIIIILNADDELLPGALIRIDKEFNNDIDILYGNAIWEDTKRKICKVKKAGTRLQGLIHNMILIHPATFIKKKSYVKYGLYNTKYNYCMDKELLYRMYKSGAKFKYVDKEFSKMKSGGISDKDFIKVLQEGERMSIYYGINPFRAKFLVIIKILKCKMIRIYKLALAK